MGRIIPRPLTSLHSSNSSVFDVAKYILTQTGEISALMLQKLAYYCEAWALAWFHTSLFPQRFEAWRRGPVCKKLFEQHKDKFVISAKDIQGERTLSDSEKHLINNVLAVYGQEDSEWLSALTHSELPWKKRAVIFQTRASLTK